MKLAHGWLVLGRFRGAPVRIHWTTPLGLFAFCGFRVVPWAWLGMVLLVLIHELGHAEVVQRVKARVASVEVLPFGGLCRWSGQVSPLARAAIAWGGIWAQLLVLLTAWVARWIAGPPESTAGWQLYYAFTSANLWMIGFNLLPIPPLDGAEAWPFLPRLRERIRRRYWALRYGEARQASREVLKKADQAEELPPEVVDKILEQARGDRD